MRDRKLVGSRQRSLLSFQFASSWETSASRELSKPLLRSKWSLVSIEWTLDRNNLRSNWFDTKSATGSTDSIQQIRKIMSEQNLYSELHWYCQKEIMSLLYYHLNLTLSKVNNSVVTVRRGHFVNSVFVNPGVYPCAVDAFMEISMHLFLPYLSNLRKIREPVWSYTIDLCS